MSCKKKEKEKLMTKQCNYNKTEKKLLKLATLPIFISMPICTDLIWDLLE